MKKQLLALFLLLAAYGAYAQYNRPRQFIQSTDWVQGKNYYLLTLFEQDKAVSAALKNDETLASLTKKKFEDLNASANNCKDAACFIAAIRFTADEIETVSKKLSALCRPGSPLEILVKTKLVPSYTYSLYRTTNSAELLVKAWEQDANGVNYAIDVYAGGKKPNYPAIDSIDFKTNTRGYRTLMYDTNVTLTGDVQNNGLFFEPAMQAALLYLQMNERQDPANYEPMAQTVNKPAADHIKITDFAKYPYTVILIPGAGPEEPGTALSAEGMLRCRLAVQQYRARKAPYIMPSGGKVHPYKTKFCEAEEMKKYMVKVLHVPEYAIIMEPHARHTTTNMRNGVRLMYRYGIPTNKPGLVVTDKSQTDYILAMEGRCMKELQYVPYKLGKHLSDTAVEYFAVPEAMQINPYEPLDP